MRKYEMKDLPIEELTKVGLFKDGKIQLSKEDQQNLLQGVFTSLQTLEGLKINGEEQKLTAKIRLITDQGQIKLGILPSSKTIQMHDNLLTPEEKEELKKGNTIIKDIKASGVLLAAGKAPYKNIKGNTESFYITVEREGKQKTMWGKDLETALKNSQKKVGDNIQIAYTGKESVTISPKQVLELEGKKQAFETIEDLRLYLLDNITDSKTVKINDKELTLENEDLKNPEWFEKRYDEYFKKETSAERNSWEVSTYYPLDEVLSHLKNKASNKGGGSEEDETLILEYDKDTENFIGVNTEDIPRLNSVNGEELTDEQKREFQEGKNVILPDNTEIGFSPIKGFKSNRSALLLSIVLDGGLSFMLFHTIRFAAKKIKLQSQEKESYKKGYLTALENHKNTLVTKLEQDPLNRQLRKEMAEVANEIKRYKGASNDLETENKENKVLVPINLSTVEIKEIEKELGRLTPEKEEELMEKYKEDLKKLPDTIDGLELSNADKLSLLTGKLILDDLVYSIEDNILTRTLEGYTNAVTNNDIAILEKVEDPLTPDAEVIENIAKIKMQLDYLGFIDKDLQSEIEAKIKEKNTFTANFSMTKEGIPMHITLDFKEKEGKLKWQNFVMVNEETGNKHKFTPSHLWTINQAASLLSGEVIAAKLTKDNITKMVDIKLDFETPVGEGYKIQQVDNQKQAEEQNQANTMQEEKRESRGMKM